MTAHIEADGRHRALGLDPDPEPVAKSQGEALEAPSIGTIADELRRRLRDPKHRAEKVDGGRPDRKGLTNETQPNFEARNCHRKPPSGRDRVDGSVECGRGQHGSQVGAPDRNREIAETFPAGRAADARVSAARSEGHDRKNRRHRVIAGAADRFGRAGLGVARMRRDWGGGLRGERNRAVEGDPSETEPTEASPHRELHSRTVR